MSDFDIDKFPASKTAKRMLRRVSPVYQNSYFAKWMYQVMGLELDEAREIVLSLREQAFTQTVTWGIELQERKYSIEPDESLTLEQRRARLYRRKAKYSPMNPWYLETYIREMWGIECEIDETYAPGVLRLCVSKDENGDLRRMEKDLRDNVKPSHLSLAYLYALDLIDQVDIDENRKWTINLTKNTKDIYPWRGRTFDTSWTFIPPVSFDGTWYIDGQYHFDGIPMGAEDDTGVRFAFDGDWWFDGARHFGYPVSRKVLWGTAEPDELTVTPCTAIKEQYAVQLPFDVFTPFDTGWAFGARDGPQDARFDVGVAPVLLEHLALQDKEITVVRPVLRDVYPLVRIRSFDGSWHFREVIPFDGLWQWQGDPEYRLVDNRYEPWNYLPASFFGEANKTLETVYEEVQLSFNGSWAFIADSAVKFGNALFFDGSWAFAADSAVRFGQTLQIPHTVEVEDDSHSGKLYDGSWQFFGLHDADVFWDENSQERFRILEDEPETEALQVQEESLLQTGAEFAESILHCPAFDGSWQFEGLNLLGTSRECFEALPTFGKDRSFNSNWAFERCSRVFDGSWNLGEDPLHFDSAWHFGGESYFAANDIPEEAETDVRTCLSERLEHYAYFGTEKTAFDGRWKFGGSAGLQELESTLQLATVLADAEELQEETAVSISVSFREELPTAPVAPFDGSWPFAELRPFDGNWHFADWQIFGASEDGSPVFRQELEAEYLQVDEPEEGSPAYSEILHHTDSFDGALAFDGEWAFGKTNGLSEGLALSIALVARFDGTWAFDDEPRKIDGTWNLGDEDYAFGDNVSPRNTYDGSWNFDSMNTRIRFERRWRSFGSITFAA